LEYAKGASMIADGLVEILRCPQDRSRVRRAREELVARVNRAIAAGTLANRAGKRLETAIDGGLLREAGDWLYPIVDDIPLMMADEAIEIQKLAD
jgi:uncharacterized protein YbaR (Trm112 family)